MILSTTKQIQDLTAQCIFAFTFVKEANHKENFFYQQTDNKYLQSQATKNSQSSRNKCFFFDNFDTMNKFYFG